MKNVRQSYKTYCRDVKEPIDLNTYLNIVHSFLRFIMNQVIEGEQVTLPQKLGSISIQGKKVSPKTDPDTGEMTNLAPDWVRTKKLWNECPKCKKEKQLVYHLNEHTNGIRYRFNWRKRDVLVKNKTLYSLVFTREHKRTVSNLVNQGKEYLTTN